jgi:starvation-inducible outer membrane lipoprotein
MAVVEYSTMRRVGLAAVLAMTLAGCVTPVVLENPTTRERVNCTLEAERLAYAAPNPSTGTDVPWSQRASPTLKAFDIEQQCAGSLLNAGFVCLSGCTTPPR